MKRFKDWFVIRESLDQNKSLSKPASSSYMNQQQELLGDKKLFNRSWVPMDSNLDPAKKKLADEVKKMLIGDGTGKSEGIIGEADEIINNNRNLFSDYAPYLDGSHNKAEETNDINVLDKIIDLYYRAFAGVGDRCIGKMQAQNNAFYAEDVMKFIPIIRSLEELKLKTLLITGKQDTYVGSGPFRRSNMFDKQIRVIVSQRNTY